MGSDEREAARCTLTCSAEFEDRLTSSIEGIDVTDGHPLWSNAVMMVVWNLTKAVNISSKDMNI